MAGGRFAGFALLTALVLAVAPAAASAQISGFVAARATTAHDPAKIALGVQILDNLQVVRIIRNAGESSLRQDPDIAAMPATDQALLISLFDEELDNRKTLLLTAMSEGNVDRFTVEQLQNLLIVSRIRYVQDLCLNGADPSLAKPDPSSMTAQEESDFLTIGSSDYFGDFLDNFDFSREEEQVAAAVAAAYVRFLQIKAG